MKVEGVESDFTFASDNMHREKLIGVCEVSWRDGVRSTLARHFPDAVMA